MKKSPFSPAAFQAYEDMLSLSHPTFRRHPPMPRENRAAQFAPFAALTGHEAALREQARLTTSRRELDADVQAQIDHALTLLHQQIHTHPIVRIVYFCPDMRKTGGCYRTVQGHAVKLDPVSGVLTLQDGTGIPMADITLLESPLFSQETSD